MGVRVRGEDVASNLYERSNFLGVNAWYVCVAEGRTACCSQQEKKEPTKRDMKVHEKDGVGWSKTKRKKDTPLVRVLYIYMYKGTKGGKKKRGREIIEQLAFEEDRDRCIKGGEKKKGKKEEEESGREKGRERMSPGKTVAR